jgi:multiple sugar transport system ATP-binding protein
MADVRLEGISKKFAGVAAVENVDLAVPDGEFLVLIGPSGSGKTTVLRMISGLEEPTAGRVHIGGTLMNGVSPKDRNVAMVFQNYALYPHMTVYENMAFGLRTRGFPAEDIDSRVKQAAAMLSLGALLKRKPKELSGGERQRVAVGRAIVRQPGVFLMDEPLSSLDAQLRAQTRTELIKLHRRLNTTMIYVTHDQVEAMSMGQRIVLMDKGRIQQVGTPWEIYDNPRTLFVARFIGSPSINVVPVEVERMGNLVMFQSGRTTIHTVRLSNRSEASVASGDGVLLGIRPENVIINPGSDLRSRVEIVETIGADSYVTLSSAGASLVMRISSQNRPGSGDQLPIAFHRILLFNPTSGERIEWPI